MCRGWHSDKQHEAALLCNEAVWLPSLEVKVRRQLDAELHSDVSPDTIEVKLRRTVQTVAVSEGVLHRRCADSVMVHLKQSNPQG